MTTKIKVGKYDEVQRAHKCIDPSGYTVLVDFMVNGNFEGTPYEEDPNLLEGKTIIYKNLFPYLVIATDCSIEEDESEARP